MFHVFSRQAAFPSSRFQESVRSEPLEALGRSTLLCLRLGSDASSGHSAVPVTRGPQRRVKRVPRSPFSHGGWKGPCSVPHRCYLGVQAPAPGALSLAFQMFAFPYPEPPGAGRGLELGRPSVLLVSGRGEGAMETRIREHIHTLGLCVSGSFVCHRHPGARPLVAAPHSRAETPLTPCSWPPCAGPCA